MIPTYFHTFPLSRAKTIVATALALTVFAIGVGAGEAPIKPPSENAATYQQRVLPFLKKHCYECHDEKSAKAGVRIDDLGTDFLEGRNADRWREVIDQVGLGKMPKRRDKPDSKEAFALIEWVNQELRDAEKRAQSTSGRAPMRRLNRSEYANTVRDLLHLDENFVRKIEQELPADGKVDGFDRGGAALFVDKSQLQAYLDVADSIVREALPPAPIKSTTFRAEAAKDRRLTERSKKMITRGEFLDLGDAKFSELIPKEKRSEEIERGPDENDSNVLHDGGLEISASSQYLAAGFTQQMLEKVVTRDGWYRFRVRAGANKGTGKFAVDAVRVRAVYCNQTKQVRREVAFTIDAPIEQPEVYEQKVFLRRGGKGFVPNLQFEWNTFHPWGGYHDAYNTSIPDAELRRLYWAARNNPYQSTLEAKKPPAEVEAARKKRDEAYDNLRKFALDFKGPVWHRNPEIDFQAVPRLWYEYIEVEGPLNDWPTKAAEEVFFDGVEKNGAEYARRIFTRFLPRAYRRPVTEEEVETLVTLVGTMQEKHGKSFPDAVRAALARVLVSPSFLYLQEPNRDDAPRPLNDYELANRLAYFLWNTMPDGELFQLAAAGRLREPAVFQAQAKRMIADRRSRQWVESFTGQWMRVREFDSVPVDMQQYKNYNDALREAGAREPYEFVDEILRSNLSVLNLLDSDFLVINERLAKHYGIAGVKGEQFRRVPRPADRRRGGILGMAGLLTYLSDGARTLPVRRGVYVQEVLWNKPAFLPPPGVGDLPPMVKDAVTVRQRLEKHRNNGFCASCHTTIDPLGLALENFDAIGAWRDRQNGEGRRGGENDPPIDASGVMPGGQEFKDLPQFKQILLEEKGRFLKGFTEKLLAYALGRPVGAADRELVDQVMADAAKNEYRLPAMLEAVVSVKAFQTK